MHSISHPTDISSASDIHFQFIQSLTSGLVYLLIEAIHQRFFPYSHSFQARLMIDAGLPTVQDCRAFNYSPIRNKITVPSSDLFYPGHRNPDGFVQHLSNRHVFVGCGYGLLWNKDWEGWRADLLISAGPNYIRCSVAYECCIMVKLRGTPANSRSFYDNITGGTSVFFCRV